MRSLRTRRAGLVAGAATVAALISGCSAGQVAETAILDTPIAGVDSESADGSVLVRNLQVEYNGIEGYEAGENAPLELSLYNQTAEAITVTITSQAPDRAQVVAADKVGFVGAASPSVSASPSESASPSPSGGASASPSASESESADPETSDSASPSAEPSESAAPSVTAASIKVEAMSTALFRPSDASPLQVVGLSEPLKPGTAVNLVFAFSNGAPELVLQAPVASPLTPASRGAAEAVEGSESEH
ncbi:MULTISPECIES: hypothetical protein [Actinoplanes]|uniref:hypothetical protein n=1 Tax=Actinoplanes TaxID=1865 RepID=UPI00069690F8|nr:MULTISPECIES: hypothetical protein [Actinoplanes]GLY08089.1 hypothetical protein Acsp01_84680 [Actinoplanes sp. NBRC 101535]